MSLPRGRPALASDTPRVAKPPQTFERLIEDADAAFLVMYLGSPTVEADAPASVIPAEAPVVWYLAGGPMKPLTRALGSEVIEPADRSALMRLCAVLRRPRRSTLIAFLALTLSAHAASAETLIGDCNGDGCVRVNELVTGVEIALGAAPASACEALECNGSLGVFGRLHDRGRPQRAHVLRAAHAKPIGLTVARVCRWYRIDHDKRAARHGHE